MKSFFGFIGAVIYTLLFVGLAVGTFYAMWYYIPYFFYFNIGAIVISGIGHTFKLRGGIFWWADNIATGLDQYWQVCVAPLLNLGVRTKHYFGYCDETASSVVGKNIQATNGRHWIIIEKVVSVLLEGGKPHSVPSIEKDEGAK